MIVKQDSTKIIRKMMFLLITFFMLCGCHLNENNFSSGPKYSINDCIRKLDQNFEDIDQLTCSSEDGYALISGDWDLLEKLVNLEKIKLIGIANEADAQKIFSKLSVLKKLNTVEIVDSKIGKIDKLGEIENLKILSIIGSSGGGDWFSINDLNLLGTDSRFNNLRSLTLKYIEMKTLPNLSELPNLQELSISGYDINRIDNDAVRWEQLISLEITETHVTSFDNSIVRRLNNLQTLDISYSFISDVNFVLDLPKLQSFLYKHHSLQNVDMDCLKRHPNYIEKWSID